MGDNGSDWRTSDSNANVNRRTFVGSVIATTLGAGTVSGFGTQSGQTHTLKVTKKDAPKGDATFRVTVTGTIDPTDDFEESGRDSISGNTAIGRIGPKRGTDAIRYTGEITDFSLSGPAVIYKDGYRVPAEELDPNAGATFVERVTPVDRQVSVAPDTELIFEVAAHQFSGEYIRTAWSVDGTEVSTLGPLTSYYNSQQMGFFDRSFSSTGVHEVSVTVYGEEKRMELGTVDWTVTVTNTTGNSPPTTRQISPDNRILTPGSKPVTFTLGVSDPDGDLHRIVWWKNQCDEILKMGTINGSTDRSSVTTRFGNRCPVYAWVIDETGHRTSSEHWLIRRRSRSRKTLRVTKDGAADGRVEFTVTVDGTLVPTDSFENAGRDSISGNTATGRIGPKRGTDAVRYTGTITDFSLSGQAVVYRNGQRVDPNDL